MKRDEHICHLETKLSKLEDATKKILESRSISKQEPKIEQLKLSIKENLLKKNMFMYRKG
ncbi:MAG: hypothetical protein KDD50_13165 [Bdellovibrionales bacterium]|nr:hypothetical protein [Bdellovibrionales bacterium]